MTVLGAELTDVWGLAVRRARGPWVVLVVLAVVVSIVEAATGGLVYSLLSTLVGGGPADLPVVGSVEVDGPAMALVVGAVFLLRGGLSLLFVRLQHRTGHETGAAISRDLLDRYLQQPYAELVGQDTATRVKNIYQAVPEVVVYALIPVVALLAEGLVALALGTVVVLASPIIAIAGAGYLVVVLAVVQAVVHRRLGELGARSQDDAARSLKTLDEAFSGVREIRLLGLRPAMVARFDEERQRFAKAHGLRAAYVEVPRVALEAAVGFMILGVLVLGARGGAGEDGLVAALPVLGLAGYAVARVLPSINRIAAARNNLRFGLPAVQHVIAELALPVIDDVGDPTHPLFIGEGLHLQDVEFAYGDGPCVLRELHLEVEPGQWLGVIGATGSGKSTIIDLVLGLLHPTAGRVTVDGHDLDDNAARWWPSTAIVPQEVHLFDTSIRDNIVVGDTDVDEDALAAAVTDAALQDVIDVLPGGLEARVGEGGRQLSGGQRQRVALARALYRRPQLLILDEGTSALDHETERAVFAGLRRRGESLTLIVVGHRASSVRYCDRLIVLDGGTIVASGTYEQLFTSNPLFQSLLT